MIEYAIYEILNNTNTCMKREESENKAKNITDPIKIWNYVFTDTFLDIIVKSTNRKFVIKLNRKFVIFIEINALFGLLYMSRILKEGHL